MSHGRYYEECPLTFKVLLHLILTRLAESLSQRANDPPLLLTWIVDLIVEAFTEDLGCFYPERLGNCRLRLSLTVTLSQEQVRLWQITPFWLFTCSGLPVNGTRHGIALERKFFEKLADFANVRQMLVTVELEPCELVTWLLPVRESLSIFPLLVPVLIRIGGFHLWLLLIRLRRMDFQVDSIDDVVRVQESSKQDQVLYSANLLTLLELIIEEELVVNQ